MCVCVSECVCVSLCVRVCACVLLQNTSIKNRQFLISQYLFTRQLVIPVSEIWWSFIFLSFYINNLILSVECLSKIQRKVIFLLFIRMQIRVAAFFFIHTSVVVSTHQSKLVYTLTDSRHQIAVCVGPLGINGYITWKFYRCLVAIII